MTDSAVVLYEPDRANHVARVRLNRPQARNAQNTELLYQLDTCLQSAARDPDISVIVISGNGPHFSAGHDMKDVRMPEPVDGIGMWAEFSAGGCEGRLGIEHEMYLGLCERWAAIPKPTIAQVHGRVIAGGLMLAWVCDLIVASDDTKFSDPVLTMGMPGVEYFAHPREFGFRRAKYLLFTGQALSAQDALSIGMVAEVLPREQLEQRVDELARQIAAQPRMALKLAKQSVDAAADAQGFPQARRAAFALHQLGHAHNQDLFGMPVDPTRL